MTEIEKIKEETYFHAGILACKQISDGASPDTLVELVEFLGFPDLVLLKVVVGEPTPGFPAHTLSALADMTAGAPC